MRLIGKLENEEKARAFSAHLAKSKIAHHVEAALSRDWGSNSYGTPEFLIWIDDEDQIGPAGEALERFLSHPEEFHKAPSEPLLPPAAPLLRKAPLLTYLLIVICTLLLFASESLTPNYGEEIANPFLSPVNRALFYDYPVAFQTMNKLLDVWGIEAIKDPSSLPSEGQYLVTLWNTHPPFQGFYPSLVSALQGKQAPKIPELFGSIRNGEVWRIFTPAVLHYDIFHLLFNMIWLALLGLQLEERIGVFRMLLFILIVAALSNTAQYLMGGANFMGFSGVIAAMLTFIWTRTKKAPWEGYRLDRTTFVFVTVYILAFFAFQLGAFFFEIFTGEPLNFKMANTAHLVGALAGFLLAETKLFSWRHA